MDHFTDGYDQAHDDLFSGVEDKLLTKTDYVDWCDGYRTALIETGVSHG